MLKGICFCLAALEIALHQGEKYVREQDRIANLCICMDGIVREVVCVCHVETRKVRELAEPEVQGGFEF